MQTHLFLEEIRPYYRYADIASEVQQWRWPLRLQVHTSSATQHVFDPKREISNRKAKEFKAQASEALSIAPILAYFVLTVVLPRGLCIDACNAFLKLCLILELLQVVPRGIVTPDRLHHAIKDHLDAFVRAHGQSSWTPKFHYSIHFPKMLGTFGNLISCFVHERKHRLVKRYSGSVQNTAVAYEHGVLAEITGQHLEDMADPDFSSSRIGLINPRRPSRRLQEQLEYEFPGADLAAARAARFSCFGVCCVGDVVLFPRHGGVAAGYVVFHASVDGESISCVQLFDLLGPSAGGFASRWQPTDSNLLIETSEIMDTPLWTRRHAVVTTAMPLNMRI